jgi:hypothetical protein
MTGAAMELPRHPHRLGVDGQFRAAQWRGRALPPIDGPCQSCYDDEVCSLSQRHEADAVATLDAKLAKNRKHLRTKKRNLLNFEQTGG